MGLYLMAIPGQFGQLGDQRSLSSDRKGGSSKSPCLRPEAVIYSFSLYTLIEYLENALIDPVKFFCSEICHSVPRVDSDMKKYNGLTLYSIVYVSFPISLILLNLVLVAIYI